MKKFFSNLGQKLASWMSGRYGTDELNRFLSIAALVCIVIALFVPILSFVALALLIWSMFRTYSKNIDKRKKERSAYLKIMGKIKGFFKLQKNKFRDRKTHRYYKCPKCKAQLRVPKGRGEIIITCPKCGNKIEKKT